MAKEKVFTQCTNSGPISVYVRDEKIYRIRPLQVDKNELKPLAESVTEIIKNIMVADF